MKLSHSSSATLFTLGNRILVIESNDLALVLANSLLIESLSLLLGLFSEDEAGIGSENVFQYVPCEFRLSRIRQNAGCVV
jgi:hypothetical protein